MSMTGQGMGFGWPKLTMPNWGPWRKKPTPPPRKTRPNYPASYEHRYASKANAKLPTSSKPQAEPSLLDLANELYAQFGGGMDSSSTAGLQYNPEEWARRMVNPKYDAQIAALNAAAAKAQQGAERGKAETSAGYQAIYNMLGGQGTKVGQTYDKNQEAAALYAKQQQDTINAIYEKAKGESAANMQQLGITGDPTTKLAEEQAGQIGSAAKMAQAGREFSETSQTADQNYYTGMQSASGLEGQAQQQAILRQLADTLAGYEGQKITAEGERGSALQEAMWNIMQANYQNQATAQSSSTGPSKWDVYKFLADQQAAGGGAGGAGGTGGAAPTKGPSYVSDFISRAYGDTPKANRMIDFVIDTISNNSAAKLGVSTVAGKKFGVDRAEVTPEMAADWVVKAAKNKGYTARDLDLLRNAALGYYGRS